MDHGRPCAEDSEAGQDGFAEDLHLQGRLRRIGIAVSEPTLTQYNGHAIQAVDGEVILLKFVESMSNVNNDEDLVVDKLKGDVCLKIRTVSGKSYTVSMNRLWHAIGGGTIMGKELAQSVYEKWLWIHKP